MPFLQLTVDIGSRNPEALEDALFAAGAVSVTLLDAADDPVLEPAPGQTPLWPTIVVRALFAADAKPDELVRVVREACGPGIAGPTFEHIADKAWEREWLKDFHPMRFGRRLWVCPDGLPAGDPDAVRLELDPGLAFGTGTHATTALCLEWLDAQPPERMQGAAVIDYGCGSGILGIAALKLGAARVCAMDIDPQALLATSQNAERNGVADRLEVTDDPQAGGRPAALLLANILAGPLVELAPTLARLVRPQGWLALSGLLDEQADRVAEAYRPWFDIALQSTREGWGLLVGRRHER
ncbi:MAG TPA: 50S ribosomal protein L11 methyltransferase [Steroidobacteraceae bacterium]